MKADAEFSIKKGVRNNPVRREVDRAQQEEFKRHTMMAVAIVAMLLFSAYPQVQLLRNGYQTQQLEQKRTDLQTLNRKWKLELETLRSPERLEKQATAGLHMVLPSAKNTLVIERAPVNTPGRAVVAQVR